MDSTDLQQTERRARRAYEMSRLRRAILAFSPVLVLVVIAMITGRRSVPTLAFGSGVFVFGVALLWHGHDIRRAVLPGLAAGLAPLVFAVCARQVGHACMGDACMAVCVPACAVGGLVAGAIVAFVAIRGKRGLGFWLAASGVALFTGAMGCVCAGASGLMGLGLGFVVSGAPGLISTATRSLARQQERS
jgi:hypothetical protein